MTIVGRNDSEIGITVTAQVVPVSISAVADTVEETDFALFQTYIAVAGYNEWDVFVSDGVSITTDNPTSTDLGELPRVKRAGTFPAGGTSALLELSKGAVRKTLSLDMADAGSVFRLPECSSFKTDTILTHTFAQLPADLSLGDAQLYRLKSNSAPVDLSAGYNPTTIELNPACWAAGFDYSGIPIWNSASNSPRFGMAAITAQHLLGAVHYQVPVGTRVKFLGTDGIVYERTIAGKSYIPPNTLEDLSKLTGDHCVYALNEGLPEFVSPLPICGDWLIGAMNNNLGGYGLGFGCIAVDKRRRAFLCAGIGVVGDNSVSATYEGTELTKTVTTIGWLPSLGTATDFIRSSIHNNYGVGGDSGGAVMIPTSNGLVLISLYWSPINGTMCHGPTLNAMVSSADTDALARDVSFNEGNPTGLTVTVAPDPTF